MFDVSGCLPKQRGVIVETAHSRVALPTQKGTDALPTGAGARTTSVVVINVERSGTVGPIATINRTNSPLNPQHLEIAFGGDTRVVLGTQSEGSTFLRIVAICLFALSKVVSSFSAFLTVQSIIVHTTKIAAPHISTVTILNLAFLNHYATISHCQAPPRVWPEPRRLAIARGSSIFSTNNERKEP